MTKEAPVARIIDLKARHNNLGGPECWVQRQTHRFRAIAGTPLYVTDIVSITGNTIAALEFTIGGRAGLNGPLSVLLEGDRNLQELGVGFTRKALKHYMMWRKESRPRWMRQLEIQTNGGVMGGLKG